MSQIDLHSFQEALHELSTVQDMLRFATSQFTKAKLYYGHGPDNAWDDALNLITHALHLPISVDKGIAQARLIRSERAAILDLIQKRIVQKLPAAYLTHHAYYAGLSFYVDQRVLIPRSPIKELIEAGFVPWINPENVNLILEIGTGSGCIAILCAYAFPHADIHALDISDDALDVARINCQQHHVEQQVRLYKSDVFNELPANKYDVIISNPPYVAAEEYADLPDEYYHEPKHALLAEDQGLAIVDHILFGAINYLSPQGILIVEVGNSQYALEQRYPHVPFTWLEFEHGGEGVFLLTTEQLMQYFGDRNGRK